MRRNIIAVCLVFLTLSIYETPIFALDIPDFLYDGVSRIEISGSVEREDAGEFISILLTDNAGAIGYIGQVSVGPDGSYKHSFEFNKSLAGYKLSVNLAGELINESVANAVAEPDRIGVDLELVQNYNLAAVRAEIIDYFGIYTGNGVTYVLAFASYDENGALISLTVSDEKQADYLSATQETMREIIPPEAVTCKAFVWNNVEEMLPLANTVELVVSDEMQFDTYNQNHNEWQAVNMVNRAMLNEGLQGGEGGQRIMCIAVSRDDTLLLCGNDTGGINRSTDGGRTWEDCLRGFLPGGATAIAIDPHNKNRVLAAGTTQTNNISRVSDADEAIRNITGLYLSEDAGFSWRQVLSQPGAVTHFDFREALCFDESSYDAAINGCSTAYWSRPWRLQASGGKPIEEEDVYATEQDRKGLWKTTDGGETWFCVNSEMADGYVKVHPTNGTVYVANLDGFHKSTNGGITFETILGGRIIYGLDVVYTEGYEDFVWINDQNGIWRSEDCGESFQLVSGSSFPQSVDPEDPDKLVRQLKVSPRNPDLMVLGYYNGTNYANRKYYSRDGGVTWHIASYDESKDFFKCNNRHPVFVWSNQNSWKVWSTGGDWIASSSNGGQSYSWDYDGGGEVFVDQRSTFNIYNPDILYYGSQDFHGALTTDGGKTWKHIWKCDGNQYSGFVYGTYAADANTLIALVSTRQSIDGVGSSGGWGGVSELRVSRDGGENWTNTGVYILDNHRKKWAEICYQSPTNPEVLFAANYRSDDYGYTWEKMEVDAVYTHNPYGEKELYAGKDQSIMVSYDDGATWKKYCDVKIPDDLAHTPEQTEIWDIAYDGIGNILYYVSGNGSSGKHFCKVENGVTTELTQRLNSDPELGISFQLCAVDPNYSGIVYVGGYANRYSNPNGVQRSTDGGKTFQTLSTSGTQDSIVTTGIAGGIEPYDLLVHPESGELWVAQGCNGWAKLPPPYIIEK